MNFREYIQQGFVFLDGATGSNLQEHGMQRLVVVAWLELRGVQRHLAGARKDAQVERQRGKH